MDTKSIKSKLLVVLGPTATGKTELALFLAKIFNGELVSCDSRQVYKGLDIGTGKLPSNSTYEVKRMGPRRSVWVINGIRVWMYDVVKPEKQYTVADYVKDVNRVIGEIRERGKLPIIVGGTGLYLKALLYGLANLAIPVDKNLRKKLRELSKEDLQKRLKKISLKRWNSLNKSDRENPRRLFRALELEASPHRVYPRGEIVSYNVLKIGLKAPPDILYEKINKRVYQWIGEGIIDETKNLIKHGVSKKRIREIGLQYAVILEYLDNKMSKEELIEKMQTKVRQYAKRQLTWFKKENNVCWFDITGKDYLNKVEKLTSAWYHKGTNAAEN